MVYPRDPFEITAGVPVTTSNTNFDGLKIVPCDSFLVQRILIAYRI
jgi:hypothetical protein